MNERASELVVAIAKRFIEHALASTNDTWDEAFLRYEGSLDHDGMTSIYRHGSKSAYFSSESTHDVHFALIKQFRELNRELAKTSGKAFVVALLRVDSQYDYRMHYEYQDPKKWFITKLGGQSGIPNLAPDAHPVQGR